MANNGHLIRTKTCKKKKSTKRRKENNQFHLGYNQIESKFEFEYYQIQAPFKVRNSILNLNLIKNKIKKITYYKT